MEGLKEGSGGGAAPKEGGGGGAAAEKDGGGGGAAAKVGGGGGAAANDGGGGGGAEMIGGGGCCCLPGDTAGAPPLLFLPNSPPAKLVLPLVGDASSDAVVAAGAASS